MTKDQVRTGVQQAIKLAAVPSERWHVMVQRTVLGILFVGLGIYLVIGAEGVKLYLGIGCVLIGATTWSGQIVTGTLRALLEPFKAYRRAIKGEGDDA